MVSVTEATGLGAGRFTSWGAWVLLLPAGVYMLLLFLVPIFVFLITSLWEAQGYEIIRAITIDNYVRAATDTNFQGLLLKSLALSAIAAVATVSLAFPIAYLLVFKAGSSRDLLLYLILLTVFSNYLVRIYAWRSVLSANGLLDYVIISIGLSDEPQSRLLYTPVGTVLALVNVYLPLAVLPVYAALQNVPPLVIAAARDLGAGPFRTFARVVLPLSAPGVTAGLVFIFFHEVGDFATPAMIGGADGEMIAGAIQRQFGEAYNWPLGSALAVVMVASAALVAFLAIFAIPRIIKVLILWRPR